MTFSMDETANAAYAVHQFCGLTRRQINTDEYWTACNAATIHAIVHQAEVIQRSRGIDPRATVWPSRALSRRVGASRAAPASRAGRGLSWPARNLRLYFTYENFRDEWRKARWTSADYGFSGTEEALQEHVRLLSTRGYDVNVFVAGGALLDTPAVRYRYWSDFDMNFDILISMNNDGVFLHSNGAHLRRYLWTNARPFLHQMDEQVVSGLSGVMAISEWQRRHVIGTAAYLPPVHIVPHGVHTAQLRAGGVERDPWLCIFTSSWDRGLADLVRAWPSVLSEVPQAKLIVTFGAPTGGAHDSLRSALRGLGITDGAHHRTPDEMALLYQRASLWLHPCAAGGTEMFCISAIKAQCAGAVPVVIPCMALNETVRVGIKAPSIGVFASEVVRLLRSPSQQAKLRRQMSSFECISWAHATTKMEMAWTG